MKYNFLFIAAFISLAIIGLTAPMAIGQTPTDELSSDIPTNLAPLAKELNCDSRSACMAAFNANISKGVNLAEKYNLYNQEQKKLATTFKDEVIAKLSNIKEDEFEEKIIELAKAIINNKPNLAKQLSVDAPKIKAIEAIVEEVKGVGANMNICSQPAEVLTHQQLVDCLNASRKLAEKKETVKAYISEKKLNEIGQVLNLQEAINRGEYKELGKNADEIGTKCLQSGSSVICDEIAKKFFGEEGLKMLANARSQVKNTEDYYKKAVGNFSLTLPNGKIIVGQEAIRNACDNAFKYRDIAIAKTCGEFGVKNGFIKQEEFEQGLKFLQSVTDKSQNQVDFNLCRKDPRACEQYMPDDMKQNFNIMADVEKIMVQSIGFDPKKCERGYLDRSIGEKCLAGSKIALPQLEELIQKSNSAEARRIIDDIKMHISEGERVDSRRVETEQVFQMEGGPGGCKSSEKCFKYCSDSQNSLECLSFGAKQGFIAKEQVSQRFEQYTERMAVPMNTIQPPIEPSQQQPMMNYYRPPMPTTPNGYNPDGSPVTMGSGFVPNADCMKAIQIGDFEKAKTLCSIYLSQPLQMGQIQPQMMPNQYTACPVSMPSPCPMGQYRETQFVNSCAVYGACIIERQTTQSCPIITMCPIGQYHPPDENGCHKKECVSITTQQSKLICPAMPTVESCPAGQNKILAYSSPECGSYYTCSIGTQPIQPPMPPKEGMIFPYRFSDGHSVLSMEDAKNYCWTNRSNNQSIAEECRNKFGIDQNNAAPPPPVSTTDKWLNHIWYFKDSNSVNSYILNRNDDEYVNLIKKVDAQCQTISKERFSWLPNAGNDSADNWRNFGIPDCSGSMTTSCPSGNYWNGNACVPSATATCPANNYWNGNACVPTTGTSACTSPSYWNSSTNSCYYPPTTTTCSSSQYWNGTACVNSNYSSIGYCGDNICQSNESATSCGSDCMNNSTTGTTCPSGNYWNGNACVPSTPPTCPADNYWNGNACVSCPSDKTWDTTTKICKSRCLSGEYWDSKYQFCRSLPTCSSATYWDANTQTCEWRTANTPVNTETSVSCPSGQYWNGSVCMNSSTTSSCPSGNYWNGNACVPTTGTSTCTPPSYWNSSTNSCYYPPTTTTCSSSQYWNGTACVPANSTTNTCISPSYWNTSTNSCSYPSPTTTCPTGQYWDYSNSACRATSPTDTTSSCPSGNYWNGNACVPTTGTSACTSPSYWNGTACVSSGSATNCMGGQYWSGTSCVCPSNQYWNGSTCTTSGSTSTGYCGDNICQSYESATSCGSDCMNNSTTGTTCPSGNYWNGNACVPTTPTDCPSGNYWNGNACVPSMPVSGNCASPSYWNSSTNSCVTPSTATSCPSGNYWNGNACVPDTAPTSLDPSTTCSQSGGTWDTSTNSCQFPPTSFIGPMQFLIVSTYNYFSSVLANIFHIF